MSENIQSFCINSKLFRNNVVSSQGGRKDNQDRCGLVETQYGLLVVVCDGMGGARGGARASRLAVEEIVRFICEPGPDDDKIESAQLLLKKAILNANQLLIDTSRENPSLAGMGTTVTAVLINEDKATLAHVGDSRIYQIRNGKVKYRTFDHSMVFEMVRKKIITEEQARLSAQSNVITRALGQNEELDVDTHECSYDEGDIFFLCTDGIWGTMPQDELVKRISIKHDPKVVTETLAEEINHKEFLSGGGHDNLTAAMLVTTRNSIIRSKMENKLKKLLYLCAALLLVSLAANVVLAVSNSKANAQKEETTEQEIGKSEQNVPYEEDQPKTDDPASSDESGNPADGVKSSTGEITNVEQSALIGGKRQ